MDETIRVGLVEDHHLIRKSLANMVREWNGMEVVFESEDGHSVLNRLASTEELPHILIVDLQLPNKGDLIYSGMHLTVDLQRSFPGIRVLILSMLDDLETIADLIQKGAHGFLSKGCSPEELRHAIHAVHTMGSYINEQSLEALQQRLNQNRPNALPKNDELTSREIDVLRLICQQLTAEEIGEKLFISSKTVNGHRNNLLQKTGSRNITGLVMYAVKHGLVEVA